MRLRSKAWWLCQCDCGRQAVVRGDSLSSGNTRSCGCLRLRSRVGGKSFPRLHKTWANIKKRCTNPNGAHWKYYGGRGIRVCDEWANNFGAFRDWALANGYRDDLTIDRKDNDGDYEPGNCRWATREEQNNNRRNTRLLNHQGRSLTIKQWARELGVPPSRLHGRLRIGWPINRVLSTGKYQKIS